MSAPTAMPRRQSCDRCHNQKVRCFTDGPEEIFTAGGTADDEVNSNGHFVCNFPCRRCKKAGALCIFSPQLRSGRPRLMRNSPPQPGRRKRASASTSLLSGQAPLSPSRSMSNSPLPVPTPYVGLMAFGDQGYYDTIPSLQVTPHTSALDPPGVMTPVSHLGLEDQAPGPWLSPPFDTNHISTCYPELPYSLASTALPTQTGTNPDPLLFSAPIPPTSEALHVTNLVWDSQGLNSEDHFGELSQIHTRICHISRTALPIATPPSSTLSNEIFEAGCSLANLLDRYTASRSFEPDSWTSPLSIARDVHESVDTSFCLMAIACQQVIFAAFQTILASTIDSLDNTPRSHVSSDAPVLMSTSTSEAYVTLKLANHLFCQLDLSFSRLIAVTGAPDQESGSPSSPPFSDQYEELGNTTHPYQQQSTAAAVFGQVNRRNSTVRRQVETVKILLRSSVA